jgi:hypothetical protein
MELWASTPDGSLPKTFSDDNWRNDNTSNGTAAGDNWRSDDDFYGVIESRPSDTAGTWVIGGRSFNATTNTILLTDDGPLNSGVCTSVDFEGDTALKIESEPASDCAR